MTTRPLYKEVKSQVIQSLIGGEWKAGQMLPAEPELAARYRVGIATIRAAIGELAAASVLVRKQGKGTYVSVHDQQRSVYQFFHVVRDDGVKELPASELVSLRKATADRLAAELLQLPRGRAQQVFRLRNILRVSGRPVVTSDITIPASLFPGMSRRVVREGGATLYAVYQSRYEINIIRTVEELRACKADAAVARLFGLRVGEPVLEIRRTAFTFNDRPVEIRRSTVLTNNYHYLLNQGGTD